ncbi:SDR family oxidoreductase [Rhodococcus fascians]|nr:SDR family oxidoreductase [Rhodococcus fascians]MBY4058107.1 SDR family oxidoreductase [Rhodococcus fascians]MBY4069750.1 SDR family oxidoreductase [Rhodococcus fascians]
MSETRRFLVTGASGLVGSEVVARLHRAGHSVVALTHRVPDVIDSAGTVIDMTAYGEQSRGVGPAVPEAKADLSAPMVSYAVGDVRRSDFGLTPALWDRLCAETDVIVHCAASTDFAAAQTVYDELNVGGTVHACRLALAANAPLIYVGTAYVCGKREGAISESDLSDAHGFGNGYERSKFQAEMHLRSLEGLQWTVVRPGIVTGYADTGLIRDRKNLYTVVKLIVEGKLRTLPGRYDATLSLAPTDFVADVVVAAATHFDLSLGNTFHAVGDSTLSLRQMSDVLAEYPSFEVARFVPTASFSVDDLDRVQREYYLRIGVQYANYFDGRRTFDTTNTSALLGRRPPDTGADYLRVLLDDCLEAGFLGSALPSISEVIQCSN